MSTYWGPWTTGLEFWGFSDSFFPVARWQVSGDGPDATAGWEQAVVVSGASSTVGVAIDVMAVVQANAFSPPTDFGFTGQQVAVGFDATQARADVPIPSDFPPGALDFEYEVDGDGEYILGPYLGGARLHVYINYNSGFLGWLVSGDPLDVRLELRVLDVPASALQIPGLAYDASGPTVFSTDEVPYGPRPAVDVTAHADPSNGEFVVTSAVNVITFSPPTASITNYYRGASGGFDATVEYRCRTPRVRWLYEGVLTGELGDVRRAFS